MQSLTLPNTDLVSLLAADTRPTFVVYLADRLKPSTKAFVAYRNSALLQYGDLAVEIQENLEKNHATFWSWIVAPDQNQVPSSISYYDSVWTRTIIRNVWAIIGTNYALPPTSNLPLQISDLSPCLEHGSVYPLDGTSSREDGTKTMENAQPDVIAKSTQTQNTLSTVYPTWSSPGLSLWNQTLKNQSYHDAFQSFDWGSTSLGPLSTWPIMLRNVVDQILVTPEPCAIYWGSSEIAIYNEEFGNMWNCGLSKAGKPAKEVLETHFPNLLSQMSLCSQVKSSYTDESFCVVKFGDDEVEKCIRSTMTPLRDTSNRSFGFLHRLVDVTKRRMHERQKDFLNALQVQLQRAQSIPQLWENVNASFQEQKHMGLFPISILHSTATRKETKSPSTNEPMNDSMETHTIHFEGAVGVPADHPILTQQIGDYYLRSHYISLLTSSKPIMVQTEDHSLPMYLAQRMEWNDTSCVHRKALLVSIQPKRDHPIAFLFLGLNPRHQYTEDMSEFALLLSQQISFAAASILLTRGEAIGSGDRNETSKDIQRASFSSMDSVGSSLISIMKQTWSMLPVGVLVSNAEGSPEYYNDAWDQICNPVRDGRNISDLLGLVHPEDQPKLSHCYQNLNREETSSLTFRLRKLGLGHNASSSSTPLEALDNGDEDNNSLQTKLVLACLQHIQNSDGGKDRIVTCLFDVSSLPVSSSCSAVGECLGSLAEFSNVGMFHMTMEGRLLNANNAFYELSGLSKVDLKQNDVRPWLTCVSDQDLATIDSMVSSLQNDGQTQSQEICLRQKRKLHDGHGNNLKLPMCVLANFIPGKNETGDITSYTGCISDISLQKWRLDAAKQLKREAVETKRQQEAFIDMTSHELRNPLSSIMHCADEMVDSLCQLYYLYIMRCHPETMSEVTRDMSSLTQTKEQELLDVCVDTTETIVACVGHQKFVVDDILTMSKLESKLLTVTPCVVDPIETIRSCVKMFEMEARRNDIKLSVDIDPSFTSLGHTHLELDPTRMKQVLVNLLVNAIKFTKGEPKKEISVRVKGSMVRPTGSSVGVYFINTPMAESNTSFDPSLGITPPAINPSEPVYLQVEVRDTGKGLSRKEMRSIFNRFQQANAKTHVTYGGSGLGLFISRRLTELQKGEIGVASEPGVGSTFAFYIVTCVPGATADYVTEDGLQNDVKAAVGSGHAVSLGPRRALASLSRARDLLRQSLEKGPREHTMRSESPNQIPRTMPRKVMGTVLIVEDNPINRKITERALKERGIATETATHGLDALAKLTKNNSELLTSLQLFLKSSENSCKRRPIRPANLLRNVVVPTSILSPYACVLMDMEMPVLDGLSCTKFIRALEDKGCCVSVSGSRIPIIGTSGNSREKQLAEARAAGCDEVLVKPYSIKRVVEVLLETEAKLTALAGTGQTSEGTSGPSTGGGGEVEEMDADLASFFSNELV